MREKPTVVLQTAYCGGLLENFLLLVSLLTVHDEEFVAAIQLYVVG